jgi:D-alanine-D-alanine ligase
MRTVVGVLRGGPSSEYEVSLQTGASVLEHIDRERYEPRDLFIDRSGQWHVHGLAVEPAKALFGVDVAFNALHGEFGEDGEAQRLLDQLAVPYTGSGAFASGLAFNKHLTKEAAKKLGVKVAHGVVVERGESEALAHKLFRTFPHPAVVKPLAGGSSVGVSLADSYHALKRALDTAFAVANHIVVEEYIKGREATVGVIDDFRGQKAYALMPVEIIPAAGSAFYDYDAKYVADSRLECPSTFSDATKQELERAASAVHTGLGLGHYSRSDFIVSRRGVYFLEVNTHPGLTGHSNFPQALRAAGSSLKEFITHVIDLARKRK